ncbi:hypothetical protein U732_138 [Clostridium argentinense CDC 2741]|uniref:Uncharacterized protein n=1 Tax=Clostridium argentinense CDC 2741 TaxID=1418104 RepID=A0A0C1TUU0_9CLOT|nr:MULTISPECIES: hypothetical protein [Clostridium]KIE44494.1 hypothetical protein U732_138 [Clostridium argentinense CDC 2741]
MSHREPKKAKKTNKEYTKNEKPEMIKSGDMKKQKRGGSIDLE